MASNVSIGNQRLHVYVPECAVGVSYSDYNSHDAAVFNLNDSAYYSAKISAAIPGIVLASVVFFAGMVFSAWLISTKFRQLTWKASYRRLSAMEISSKREQRGRLWTLGSVIPRRKLWILNSVVISCLAVGIVGVSIWGLVDSVYATDQLLSSSFEAFGRALDDADEIVLRTFDVTSNATASLQNTDAYLRAWQKRDAKAASVLDVPTALVLINSSYAAQQAVQEKASTAADTMLQSLHELQADWMNNVKAWEDVWRYVVLAVLFGCIIITTVIAGLAAFSPQVKLLAGATVGLYVIAAMVLAIGAGVTSSLVVISKDSCLYIEDFTVNHVILPRVNDSEIATQVLTGVEALVEQVAANDGNPPFDLLHSTLSQEAVDSPTDLLLQMMTKSALRLPFELAAQSGLYATEAVHYDTLLSMLQVVGLDSNNISATNFSLAQTAGGQQYLSAALKATNKTWAGPIMQDVQDALKVGREPVAQLTTTLVMMVYAANETEAEQALDSLGLGNYSAFAINDLVANLKAGGYSSFNPTQVNATLQPGFDPTNSTYLQAMTLGVSSMYLTFAAKSLAAPGLPAPTNLSLLDAYQLLIPDLPSVLAVQSDMSATAASHYAAFLGALTNLVSDNETGVLEEAAALPGADAVESVLGLAMVMQQPKYQAMALMAGDSKAALLHLEPVIDPDQPYLGGLVKDFSDFYHWLITVPFQEPYRNLKEIICCKCFTAYDTLRYISLALGLTAALLAGLCSVRVINSAVTLDSQMPSWVVQSGDSLNSRGSRAWAA